LYITWYVLVDAALITVFTIAAVCVNRADLLQCIMWRMLLLFFFFDSLVDVFECFNPWGQWDGWSPSFFESFLAGDVFGVICCSLPCLRHAVHRLLSRMFSFKGAKVAAASIAALIGDCRVQDVVAQAVQSFRCVLLSDLSRAELASSTPDPDLHARTKKVKLGECDAFISHSWSDDEGAKWAALQRWCRRFEAEHGREPTLWFDKCCIDQTDIETSLRCLPVFISGCRQLVVLCGPTFFSRLWCVLELFTHHHMGLGARQLTMVWVLREDHGDSDFQSLHWEADNFDVLHCNCSSPDDMQKIMDVILATFGSPELFNQTIRGVLRDAGMMDDSSDDSDTSESDSLHRAAGLQYVVSSISAASWRVSRSLFAWKLSAPHCCASRKRIC
jgi:hypothetical protein